MSVIVAFVIGTTQVLDDTVIGPVSVDVAPIAAVIVPVICPTQVGCVGIPPGPTEMVNARLLPVTVPFSEPFNNTIPVARLMRAGPVTAAFVWLSVQVMRAV